jgi:hypothetical protein
MPLPDLLRLEDCPGSDTAERWKVFLEVLYQVFLRQLANAGLTHAGQPVKCRYHPSYDNKHGSFWHLITEGKVEDDRTPVLDRCTHLQWIAWIIQNAGDASIIRSWEQQRSTSRGLSTRIPLWLFQENYVVILEKRQDFSLIVTAFSPEPHQVETYEREWKEWTSKKAETAN